VTARTSDGVIEAVELESVPFGVAVQWHPEESREDIRLFAGLVEAARQYRAEEQDSATA
jgi:putative glutamine amidotransferase